MNASSDKVSWWDDDASHSDADAWEIRSASRKPEQPELWLNEQRAAEKADVFPPAAVVDANPVVFQSRFEEKRQTMTMLDRAKFLRISRALYDGKDEGRWFNLPAAKASCLRSQMTNTSGCKVESSLTHRSAPRFADTQIRQRNSGYLFS